MPEQSRREFLVRSAVLGVAALGTRKLAWGNPLRPASSLPLGVATGPWI
jgi:hypothetical protein